MGFPSFVCSILEQITTQTPSAEEPDIWYGPWNAILHTLFSVEERYMVCPSHKRHIERDAFGTERYSDLIMEIVKVIDEYDPNLDRTVLIFEIKNSCHWEERGKEALMEDIAQQADDAFSELRTPGDKVYWIGAIGPHWIYGDIEDGQDPRPLIEWHDVTHDEASYRDFLNLVELVTNLIEDGQA
jgi:hypothetical protein